jgi:uncharacterized protein YaiI (UPF0178 family)
MKIWIDADAAPRDVKDVVYRAARRLAIPVALVANQPLTPPAGFPLVTAVRVAGGPDVADRHIADHAVAGDLAVTADIPLAARLVANGVTVVDPRGDEYSAENVNDRLATRDLLQGLRGAGVDIGGPRPYSARDRQAFAAALDRLLTRARKP